MRLLSGHGRGVRALAYSPAPGSLLASAGDDRTTRLWEAATGREVALMETRRDGALCVAFSGDGKRLAVGGRSGFIISYDVATRQRDPGPGSEMAHGPVVALSFTGNGRAILAAARSCEYLQHDAGRLVCWNLSPVHPLSQLDYSGTVETTAFCPARDLLAIAGHHRGVEFLEMGRPRNEPAFFMPGRVKALAFSPGDGRYLAVAGGKTVGIWDVEAGQWRSQCHGHKGDVNALAFSPDGLALLSGGMDRSVRLFETLSGRQLATWDWKLGIVRALAYAGDGMTAAAAGDKPQVVVWDVDEG